jgi:predicted amidohydrolase
VQLQSTDTGNFAKMQTLATQAKAQGAALVIFPEESVFGWLNPAVFTEAAPIPGKYSDQFAAIAVNANIWVATGLAEQGPKAGPGSLPNAYQAYDSGILINPQGQLVLHHRKFNVLQNAFDPAACKRILNQDGCSYTPGPLSDITTVATPFGKTSLLVCADAYTYAPAQALATLKPQQPDFVIVPWGITSATQNQCGTDGFNATGYASQAASYLKSAVVVGANAVGPRNYGRFLPSVYCGTSGYAEPTGQGTEAQQPAAELVMFHISKAFDANAGPIWSNTEAPRVCPGVCTAYSSRWNGQWKTTVPGQMSVCGCAKP